MLRALNKSEVLKAPVQVCLFGVSGPAPACSRQAGLEQAAEVVPIPLLWRGARQGGVVEPRLEQAAEINPVFMRRLYNLRKL